MTLGRWIQRNAIVPNIYIVLNILRQVNMYTQSKHPLQHNKHSRNKYSVPLRTYFMICSIVKSSSTWIYRSGVQMNQYNGITYLYIHKIKITESHCEDKWEQQRKTDWPRRSKEKEQWGKVAGWQELICKYHAMEEKETKKKKQR